MTRNAPIAIPSLPEELAKLVARAEAVLERVELLLPPKIADPDWKKITAARWRKRHGQGVLQAVAHPHSVPLDHLVSIDAQKRTLDQNTRQFVAGQPANNVLLTGSRGTGKSSLIKAMLARYQARGLRLVEVDKADLADLPDIVERIEHDPHHFVLFCDDLTFDVGEAGYKALKVALDGSIAGAADNVVIYATSNRRHLLPEYMSENLETRHVGDEVHPGESVEEKIALSERFGLWISFYPFQQDDYLAAVAEWLDALGVRTPARDIDAMHRDALQFALGRGSRSGRVAWQYAKHVAGSRALRGK